MLTGSSETIKHATAVGRPEGPARNPIPPMKTGPNKKPSKLYEQRNSLKNFKISHQKLGTQKIESFLGFQPRFKNQDSILISDCKF
ncbi:hypothetical protein R6Q57_026304 [Mikania cordata]